MRQDLPRFTIDRSDWLAGNNSAYDLPDGGLQNYTVGANVFSEPGLLAIAPYLGTNTTASLPALGVLSWGGGKGAITLQPMCVMANTSGGDGSYYTVDDVGVMTKVGATDTSQDYSPGFTDTRYYHGAFYTTSRTDIVKNSTDLGTRDLSFWITTSGHGTLQAFSPHPMEVFGDILYIADGQYLHQLDGAVTSTQVLDLGTDWTITAIVNYNNLLYITAEAYLNANGQYHGITKMFTWDGFSDSWLDEWTLNYRVDALYVYENVLYIFDKQFMGYWDGARKKNLRVTGNQIFRHNITETSDSMFYVNGSTVVRYGTPQIGAQRRFWNYWQNVFQTYQGITSFRDNRIILSENGSSNSSVYYVADANGPGTINFANLFFNKRTFRRAVHIRGVVVETDPIPSGGAVSVTYLDDNNTSRALGTFNTVGKMKKQLEGIVGDFPASRWVFPVVQVTGGAYVREISFYYEASENDPEIL